MDLRNRRSRLQRDTFVSHVKDVTYKTWLNLINFQVLYSGWYMISVIPQKST
jgi:hypothetical protein